MLSSLPTELLRQVIESTISHTFHSQTYDDRQTTLCHLSLVSRLFRQMAQPLLFEIVWVQWPETLETVVDTIESKGLSTVLREAICRMRIGNEFRGTFRRGHFERLVRTGQNVRTVALWVRGQGAEVIDLSVLQRLPQLNHLRLFGSQLEVKSPFTLPLLLTLSVVDSAFAAVKPLLDPVYLPSLRNLALPDVDNAADFDDLRHSNIDKLAPQLDSISLYWRCADCAPEYLLKGIEKTLFDCYSYDLVGFCASSPLLYHLRILNIPLVATIHELSMVLNRIAIWIETRQQLSLRSLYLDSILHPTLLRSQTQAVRDGMVYLGKVCGEKQVQIVFERQPRDWQVDSVLSKEFCRRQRGLREEEHGS